MEEDKILQEAVQNLLHYAIQGRIKSLTEKSKLPTLYVANRATQEVLQWAMAAGIIEMQETEEVKSET